MEECRIDALVGTRRVTLTGHHPRHLHSFRGSDLAAEPVVRLSAPLPAGSAYLDIGANVGLTVIAVALTRPDLRTVAFEPEPRNADCLRRNIEANGVRNCTIVNAAAGSAAGCTTISDDGPWSRASWPGPEVPVVTLDSWCAQHLAGARVGLIKIDVEGYEPHVLAGAAETIAAFGPLLFMELNPACLLLQGFSPIAFARHLLAAFEIEEQPMLVRTSAIELIRDSIVHHDGFPNIVVRRRPGAPPCRPEEIMVASPNQRFACDISDLLAAISALAAELRAASDAPNTPSTDRDEVARLRDEIAAIRRSRSWRITAPLRAVRATLNRG